MNETIPDFPELPAVNSGNIFEGIVDCHTSLLSMAMHSTDESTRAAFDRHVVAMWNKLKMQYYMLETTQHPWEVSYGAARLLEAVFPFMEPMDIPEIAQELKDQFISHPNEVEGMLHHHWTQMPAITGKSNVLRLAFYKKYTGGEFKI